MKRNAASRMVKTTTKAQSARNKAIKKSKSKKNGSGGLLHFFVRKRRKSSSNKTDGNNSTDSELEICVEMLPPPQAMDSFYAKPPPPKTTESKKSNEDSRSSQRKDKNQSAFFGFPFRTSVGKKPQQGVTISLRDFKVVKPGVPDEDEEKAPTTLGMEDEALMQSIVLRNALQDARRRSGDLESNVRNTTGLSTEEMKTLLGDLESRLSRHISSRQMDQNANVDFLQRVQQLENETKKLKGDDYDSDDDTVPSFVRDDAEGNELDI